MIEPTESTGELDRFCNAMIAIREEIRAIETRLMPQHDNPLINAPHTGLDLAADTWSRPYSRMEACFPGGVVASDKYWSPVNRIDNIYGDRNLMCTCPPIEAFTEACAANDPQRK
jgi:glycine dehydrogenase